MLTPDQRFAITLVFLTAGLGVIGWVGRRILSGIAATARREQLVDDELETLRRHDDRNRDQMDKLAERLADAITKLSDLYADMNARHARMEGQIQVISETVRDEKYGR